jgi:hypothetical protein
MILLIYDTKWRISNDIIGALGSANMTPFVHLPHPIQSASIPLTFCLLGVLFVSVSLMLALKALLVSRDRKLAGTENTFKFLWDYLSDDWLLGRTASRLFALSAIVVTAGTITTIMLFLSAPDQPGTVGEAFENVAIFILTFSMFLFLARKGQVMSKLDAIVGTTLGMMLIFLPPNQPKALSQELWTVADLILWASTFFLLSGMWQFWSRMDKRNPRLRKRWFLLLLLGMPYAAIGYYLAVYRPLTRKQYAELAKADL